ncbi:MAG: enoyl-CoA hydratase/isomerase family protein [Flavobacteriaceae bacterium]|nr:enoyl-CoA hydratase/isomerase family protein [Flavobacteriaceae bacterium]
MTTPHIKQELNNGIATISFYHPNHNSLPSDLLIELKQTIENAGKNEDIRVIILKSAGDKTFCAGASFQELCAINDEEIGALFFSGFANVINAIRKCSKIVIGSIQGKAVGGGVGIAAATDYCLASKFASIKLSELTIGIGPFVVAPALERKIGLAAFSQLTLDATSFYSAEWAHNKGLFSSVHENNEELDKAVLTLAQNLANYNPEALTALKQILWKDTENWDELLRERAAISGKLVLSAFTKESLKRFKK